jgi:pimeloyl-ACP methyl ester carboxylesterase
MPPPRYPERLERVLEGLLDVDNREILPRITCSTLVIDGADDRIFGPELQREMAELIPDSRLKLYPGYGHGNDQENPDYNVQVEQFVEEVLHG